MQKLPQRTFNTLTADENGNRVLGSLFWDSLALRFSLAAMAFLVSTRIGEMTPFRDLYDASEIGVEWNERHD